MRRELFLISYFYQIGRRQVRLCCLVHSFPVSIHNSSNWTRDGQCFSYQDLRQHMYRRVLFTLSKPRNLSSSSNYVHVHICFDVIYICSKSRQNNYYFRSVEYGLVSDPNLDLVNIYIYQKNSTHSTCNKRLPATMSCTMCTALLWEEKQIRIMVHSCTCTNIM